jgi:hypothetical protein
VNTVTNLLGLIKCEEFSDQLSDYQLLEKDLHDIRLPTFLTSMKFCWDNSIGIATSYGLDDRGVGVGVPVGSRIFSSPRLPHWLWCPPSLLYNGYRGIYPRG